MTNAQLDFLRRSMAFLPVVLIFAAAVMVLAGCPGTQATAAKIQPALIAACDEALMLAPLAGPYAVYIIAGCGTVEAIDRLAADPSSTQWVGQLIGAAKALVP